MAENTTKKYAVVQITDRDLKHHLGKVVLGTVETTVIAMLNAEADARVASASLNVVPTGKITDRVTRGGNLHTNVGMLGMLHSVYNA